MSFRGRLLLGVTALTAATLGGSLTGVWFAFNHDQQRQLDLALLAVARVDARAVEQDGLAALTRLASRPGPAANDVGPLPTHDFLYAPSGDVIATAPGDGAPPPPLRSLPAPPGACFDLWLGAEHMRAVLLPVGTDTLLVATPRSDIDGDARFLAHAMALALLVAVAWSTLLARWGIHRLTRHHQAVAHAARRVADGDLSARVGSGGDDPELAQLATDVDTMIARIEAFVSAQRRFVAHAAHELRTPLTALHGELQHAIARPRDPAAYREAIEEALDASRALKSLADDLLTLASAGARASGPRGPVDLSLVLHQVVTLLAREADERGVRLDPRPAGVIVLGDEHDLGRMLRNLVENAIRHAGARHTVTLGVATSPDGRRARISIEDDGTGVPDEHQAHIFEPFFRAPSQPPGPSRGTGLGLAIAREIARSHGGDTWFDPTHTPGARFVVDLPLADATPLSPVDLPPR